MGAHSLHHVGVQEGGWGRGYGVVAHTSRRRRRRRLHLLVEVQLAELVGGHLVSPVRHGFVLVQEGGLVQAEPPHHLLLLRPEVLVAEHAGFRMARVVLPHAQPLGRGRQPGRDHVEWGGLRGLQPRVGVHPGAVAGVGGLEVPGVGLQDGRAFAPLGVVGLRGSGGGGGGGKKWGGGAGRGGPPPPPPPPPPLPPPPALAPPLQ